LGVRPRALKSGEDADAPGKTDAFVWVKSPGESDGTSNTTSEYFDTTCGLPEGRHMHCLEIRAGVDRVLPPQL
jgi:hypothetical protein